jgi:hypothetical protein
VFCMSYACLQSQFGLSIYAATEEKNKKVRSAKPKWDLIPAFSMQDGHCMTPKKPNSLYLVFTNKYVCINFFTGCRMGVASHECSSNVWNVKFFFEI